MGDYQAGDLLASLFIAVHRLLQSDSQLALCPSQELSAVGTTPHLHSACCTAAVRYRRWRNGVASGRLPDGTTSTGSSKDAAITMSAGDLFRLEDNEGFVDLTCDLPEQQQQQAAQVPQQAEAVTQQVQA